MSKGIFVAVEQRGGTVQKVSIELLGEARRLSGQLGEDVTAVLMGSGVSHLSELLIQYGADRVLVVDHPVLEHYTTEPYTKSMTHVIRTYDPNIVLFGATTVFQLVTLPVEYNASHRAIETIEGAQLLDDEELAGAKKVLSAASLTYVAALLTSVVQLLRFLLLFADRSDRGGRR